MSFSKRAGEPPALPVSQQQLQSAQTAATLKKQEQLLRCVPVVTNLLMQSPRLSPAAGLHQQRRAWACVLEHLMW